MKKLDLRRGGFAAAPSDAALPPNEVYSRFHGRDIRLRSLVIAALEKSDRREDRKIIKRLLKCTPERPCRDCFCPYCKHMYWQQARNSMGTKRPWEEGAWVTIIGKPVIGFDHHAANRSITAILEGIETATQRMARNADIGSHVTAAHWFIRAEVDVYVDDNNLGPHRLETLKALGWNERDYPLLDAHAHALVLSRRELLGVLEAHLSSHFPKNYQCEISRTWESQTWRQSVARIAGYVNKSEMRFLEKRMNLDPQRILAKRRNGSTIRRYARLLSRLGGLEGLTHDIRIRPPRRGDPDQDKTRRNIHRWTQKSRGAGLLD